MEDIGIIVSVAISVTCVPLFVLLSGSLLLQKKEDYKTFFRKRLGRLLLPWFFWTMVYVGISLYTLPPTDTVSILKLFLKTITSFWFLPMIVGLYLITPALRIFVHSARLKDILLIVVFWFMLVAFLPYHHSTPAFPMHPDTGMLRQVINYFGYFLIGYMVFANKNSKNWFVQGSLLLTVGIAWTALGIYDQSFRSNGVLVNHFYNYIAPGVVVSSVGLFILLYAWGSKLEKKISNNARSLIVAFSGASLGVYFLHTLMQRFFVLLNGKSYFVTLNPVVDNFINGFILFVATFVVIYLLQQIPMLRRLVA